MDEKITEREFILECCKLDYADKDTLVACMQHALDYPYILGHLLYNRAGGIAYVTLKANNLLGRVNREFRNTLRSIYESGLIKTESFIRALQDLTRLCGRLSVPYALLKGAYLVGLYPKGTRTSQDVDILIESKDITVLSRILKAEGFIQGNVRNDVFVPADRAEIISSRMTRGETVPYVKRIDYPNMKYLEIDVNFSLGFKPGMDEAVVRDFLSGTCPLIEGSIETLNAVDFFIHLCAHLYKEAAVMNWVELGRDISLYKFSDIYLFLHLFMDEAFSEALLHRIRAIGLEKECYYAMFYTKLLFSVDNPCLDALLKGIMPVNLFFLNRITDPQTNKMFAFNMDYKNWVFCSDRRGRLYEVEYD